MGDIEDEKGGASLYQRALAIYNEGSDEWCIPNRGTKAWAKLEAIRDGLTGNTVKPRAKRATPKRSVKATAKRATFKRNVVKQPAKASDAPLREVLATLGKKRNRVITIPRTIVGRTDEPTMDKQDTGLAKLEAKLDKALTTATDAAAMATATATASASATDAKLKKLTRKLKDATAATTAAATAVASAPAPVVNTATTSDTDRKLMKLANKLKLATDTAAAATITNNATADAKLSKLVADLRVANAQAAASASAGDAKLFRLTAELERATRAALSTLPQTPARQSALSRVGQLAANITYYTATTVAKGVASVAHGLAGAVGRKAVEYAASKVAPVPPTAPPTAIQTPTPVPPAREIPEGKQEASPRPRRAKQAKSARDPPARDAPPPPIPTRAPPSPKPSPKVSPKVSPKPSPKPEKKPRAKQPADSTTGEASADIVPLMVLPDIVIKHRDYLDVAREVGGFNIEDMGRPLLTQQGKTKRDNAFRQYKINWKEVATKYIKEKKLVSRADMNKLKKRENTADIIRRADYNMKLFGDNGGNIRTKVEAWMSAPTILANNPRASAEEQTEPEFEESAIVGSETEAPQSQPLESIDISGISSTTSTPSRTSPRSITATQSRVDESRDIPDDPLARMEGIDIIGHGLRPLIPPRGMQGFREPLTPEQFVINQMRRAVYGN